MISVEKPGTPSELVHFGIKGMKWGVRKEEETSTGKPAQPKKLSDRKVKRVRGHEAVAKSAQAQIDTIKANPSKWRYTRHNQNVQVKELEKFRDKHVKAAKDIREGHLTDYQKKLLIGAGVTAGVLAAYGTYKFIDSGTAHQLLTRNQLLKENAHLARKMSVDELMNEVVKPINPNYGDLGTKMNCRRATFAYELRRRGYDVKATNSVAGSGQTVAGMLNATTPGSHIGTTPLGMMRQYIREGEKGGPLREAIEAGGMGKTKIDFGPRKLKTLSGSIAEVPLSVPERSKAIFDAIGRNPEGARGELGVTWSMGGAHSMAWEVIGGKANVFDTQTGEHFSLEQFNQKMGSTIKDAGITRLDNATLNRKFLGKWIRNVN